MDLDYAKIKVFEGVAITADLAGALSASHRFRLQDGETLIEAGRDNHHLYILLAGQMEVRLTQDTAQFGMPITPGNTIGEMSIVDGGKTSAFVCSVGDSEVLAIHAEVFWRHLAPLPGVMRNLIHYITRRLRLTSERMIDSLEDQLKFEHLKKELAAARDIQMGLLPLQVPLLPHVPQVEVHAHLVPAKEVGGDLYDAFSIDENHILLAVGDVSGKGMPAALFMMRTLTLLRAQGSEAASWDQLLPRVNRLLCEGNGTDMFVTLSIAILSLQNGHLTILSGGHPPPLLSRQGEAFQEINGAKGPLVGISPLARYQSLELTLAPGDRIVLYTDGVTEAENPAQDMFSLEQTRAVLNAHSGDGTITALVTTLADAVETFSSGTEQSDDITILALRYLGPTRP